MLKSQQLNALVKASYVHPQGHKLRKACYNYMMLSSRRANAGMTFEEMLPMIQELPLEQQAQIKESIIKASLKLDVDKITNYVKAHGGNTVANFFQSEDISMKEILTTKVPEAIGLGLKTLTKSLLKTLVFCVDAITLRNSDTYLEEMDEKYDLHLSYNYEHKALVFLPRLLVLFAFALFMKNVANGTSSVFEFLDTYGQYAGAVFTPTFVLSALYASFNPRSAMKFLDRMYSAISTPLTTSWDIISHFYENLGVESGISWISSKLKNIWNTIIGETSEDMFANAQFKTAYLQALKSY